MAMAMTALLVAVLPAQQNPAPKDNQPASSLTTKKDKLSYSLGLDVGNRLHQMGVDIDPAILAQGVKDAVTGAKPALSPEEISQVISELQTEQRTKMQQQQAEMAAANKQLGEKNKKEAQAFLAENKSKPGVVALPDGLQYKILKEGTGPKPTTDDTVVCHYRGTLINGAEFDSSYQRGEPVTFPVKGVIKGWTEALQMMPVGSKWQLFIPSDLAYGDSGVPGHIEPDSMLIFDVELISIQKK
jgi:FKBP-type peptidyl-prolyl cis-trans isomerase